MRLIDADALMAELYKEVELADDWKTAHEIANVVKYFPTTEERKTGRWIFNQYDANPRIGNWHCSECKQITIMPHDVCNYCPNCGAKMEVEHEIDD